MRIKAQEVPPIWNPPKLEGNLPAFMKPRIRKVTSTTWVCCFNHGLGSTPETESYYKGIGYTPQEAFDRWHHLITGNRRWIDPRSRYVD